jgi:hypothetical protein
VWSGVLPIGLDFAVKGRNRVTEKFCSQSVALAAGQDEALDTELGAVEVPCFRSCWVAPPPTTASVRPRLRQYVNGRAIQIRIGLADQLQLVAAQEPRARASLRPGYHLQSDDQMHPQLHLGTAELALNLCCLCPAAVSKGIAVARLHTAASPFVWAIAVGRACQPDGMRCRGIVIPGRTDVDHNPHFNYHGPK